MLDVTLQALSWRDSSAPAALRTDGGVLLVVQPEAAQPAALHQRKLPEMAGRPE